MKRITEQAIAEMMDDPDSLEHVVWIQRIERERPCGPWHLWSSAWDKEYGPYICACGIAIANEDANWFTPISSQPDHDVCEACFVVSAALRL